MDELGFFDKLRTGSTISKLAKYLKDNSISDVNLEIAKQDVIRNMASNMSPETIGYALSSKKGPLSVLQHDELRNLYKNDLAPAMLKQIKPQNVLAPDYKNALNKGIIEGINSKVQNISNTIGPEKFSLPRIGVDTDDSGNIITKTLAGRGASVKGNPFTVDAIPEINSVENSATEEILNNFKNLPNKATKALNAVNPSGAIDVSKGASLKDLFKLTKNAAKAHPLKALGYIGGGMANLGGLFDNDKFGGQLGAGALGAIAGNALGNPIMGALIGGGLGAQFDKLRAQREATAQQAQQRMR